MIIRKINGSSILRTRRLVLENSKKPGIMHMEKLSLPVKKDLKIGAFAQASKDKVRASEGGSCSDVDYCTPLFP